MKLHGKPLLFCALWLLQVPQPARADEYTEIREAVQRRDSSIKFFKSQGLLVEGPNGLLIAAGEVEPSVQALMDKENSNRSRIFELIAVRNGVGPGEVAALFRQMATAGTAGDPIPPNTPSPVAPALPPDAAGPPSPPPAPLASPPPTDTTAPQPSALPSKIVTRPMSRILAEPESGAGLVQEDADGFSVYYVLGERDGWHQIGETEAGPSVGWLSTKDAIPWKQNLVVAFSHPDGREPAMFFKNRADLSDLVQLPQQARESRVDALAETIGRGDYPEDFPVQAVEPAGMVDQQKNLYMLPITDFGGMQLDGFDGRLLEVSALTRARRTDNLRTAAVSPDFNLAKNIGVDLVFVMDLTRSMGPFVESTLSMMQDVARQFEQDPAASERVRFGFVGFRDCPQTIPGVEFRTKNFTPELQDVRAFLKTLAAVKETKIDSIDYEEDVFAGMSEAINKTSWRTDSLRFIVLVGDAPGRPPGRAGRGFPQGPVGTDSGVGAEELRDTASNEKVYVNAIYLDTPKWSEYRDEGERQFRVLGRNPNDAAGAESFRLVDATDQTAYREVAQSIAQEIWNEVVNLSESSYAEGSETDNDTTPQDPATGQQESSKDAGRRLASNMFRGALLEWLGRQQNIQTPPDITGWVSDLDLKEPIRQTFKVQVFLTKNQLNELKVFLDGLVNAGLQGKVSGRTLFESMQAVVAAAARYPADIAKANTLADSGLVPLFLAGLPYKSNVMGMTDEAWGSLGPDGQEYFLQDILGKLRYYQIVHDNPELWVALTDKDQPDEWVAPIPLDQLP